MLDAPAQPLIIAVAEQVFTADLKGQRILFFHAELEKLLRMLRLIQRRMRSAIGEDQAIHTELAVVWRVAEVTAVGLPRLALFIIARQALIDPIPDKAALQTGMLTKRLPVFGIAAEAVAHSVSVLAQDQRTIFTRQADPFFD